ncbi:calmodulin-binding protein 60 E [Cinnamomum micranthum f. kanehirae]|uniref:Calmodulin-binding protein 60 E n=1 Tax=Cinnamomum micranthum f. kanehirae TaxID=337451 RepID=A0A3S3P5E2_9MAGN|nr:calmodulin-binding protein 60 E [Cinnamomum micranthum f. kanehirae]
MEIPTRCNRKEKRRREDGEREDEEKEEGVTSQEKKPKVPALASVIVEALKLDSLQRLCSSLEPLLRRIVSEEVERALAKLGNAELSLRNSPPKIDGPDVRKLQLHFRSKLPPHLFTGGKVEGEQGAAIHVVLLDASTGVVIPSGCESAAKLDVVVLEGDFNNEGDDDWTKEHFESFEVKERDGKRPLLTGDLQVCLKEGVGTLGDFTFTDNSSWIRSRKFRLGLKVADGYCDGIRVREAKTEAFAVKDHRGELYKKHYPPALHDEVWRLDRIAKDGALHKKLVKADILTVADFLRLLVRDPQRLRLILGGGMSNRMWENTVEHAKTCVLVGKLYVYYSDEGQFMGVVFNQIYELVGLITNGQFLSAESLPHSQKVSVDLLVKRAYENWIHVVEYDGKRLLKSINSKEVQFPPTISSNDKSTINNCTIPPPCTQHYSVSDPGMHFHIESSHFSTHDNHSVESPTTRLDPSIRLAQSTVQEASTASVGFQSVNSSTGAGYLLGDSSRLQEGLGLNEVFPEEEIRLRSSEILEHEDMQCLLRTFGVGHSDRSFYSNSAAYEPQSECKYVQERGRSSGKAVVGWLKLKAALRWGIFIRKQAAEKRAHLIELD